MRTRALGTTTARSSRQDAQDAGGDTKWPRRPWCQVGVPNVMRKIMDLSMALMCRPEGSWPAKQEAGAKHLKWTAHAQPEAMPAER